MKAATYSLGMLKIKVKVKKVWGKERMYLGKCQGKSSALVNSYNNDVKVSLPLNSTSSQMTATSKV